MFQTINFSDFVDGFNYQERKDTFSYAALQALYDHLVELEMESGTDIEYDMVSLCCDWKECGSIEEITEDFPNIKSLEGLRDYTIALELPGGALLVQAF